MMLSFNFKEVDGPYADEARDLIPIEELFVPGNEAIRLLWLRRCNQIGIPRNLAQRDRLMAIQKHIAVNPPDHRCSCNFGYESWDWEEHWEGCAIGSTLMEEQMEEELRERLAMFHQFSAEIRSSARESGA